jgi:hypothetical protein
MSELPTIPLALHSATFMRHMPKAGTDPTVSAAAHAAAESRGLAEQALTAWRTILADETLPIAGRMVRAKRTAGRLIEAIGKKLDIATDVVAAEITKLDHAMMPVIPSAVAADGEMRALLRSVTKEKRSEIFAQAAMAGADDAPYRAAFAGHPSLSGMSSDELNARRVQFQRQRHPETSARKLRLEACQRDLKVAADGVVAFAAKLFAPGAKFEQAALAANEAAKSSEAA